METVIPSFKDISIFRGLSEIELESVKKCLREKSFCKGDLLFMEGKSCERVFIVQSGRVKLYRISASGREQILETLNPGDTCACNPGSSVWSCSSTAEALIDSIVWFLSREDYVRIVQTNSKVAQALNRLFAERLQCFSALIEEVSLKDSKKRIIKFLLDMLDENTSKAGAKQMLFIPFTREEIAQRIGVTRETVARQLYQLKRSRLIDIKPKQIIISDEAGLRKLLL